MTKPAGGERQKDPELLWVTYCKCGHAKPSHKDSGCESCSCKKFKYNGEL